MTDESSEQPLDADPDQTEVGGSDSGPLDSGPLDSGPLDSGPLDSGPLDSEPLDPEQVDALEEAQRAMEDARSRLADVPAEVVVTNHVMGLYELAAIHLSTTPPDLAPAALAIDAVACLVEGLGDRLGEDADTMRDALNNIRLAFVQIQGADEPPDSD